jgi:hypothetical protein
MVIDSRPAVSVNEDLNSHAEMAMDNLLQELLKTGRQAAGKLTIGAQKLQTALLLSPLPSEKSERAMIQGNRTKS